jgi:hypothetical protein
MAEEVLKSVDQIFHDADDVDTTVLFDKMWSYLTVLREKIETRFPDLDLDPSCEELLDYQAPDGQARGTLQTWTGPGMDWLVHSHLGDPERGFTNLHLTAWLGPEIAVPHLGIAWGTLPDLWFYVDLQPRSDLLVNTHELDTYFEPLNERFLALREDDRFKTFVSRALYVRQAVSEVGLAYVIDRSEEMIDTMFELTDATVDLWLGFIDDAPEVPVEDRAALAARDIAVRRTVAERDPANVLGEQFYGKEFTDRLVRQLWGGDRVLPRPGA